MVGSSNLIIFIGLVLRLLIAIWNGFFGPSPMGEFDAITMHETASLAAGTLIFNEFSIGTAPYTNFLGLFYTIWNDVFLGSLLSCITWYFSAKLLVRSFVLLQTSPKNISRALIIYSFLPFSILITSITLREAYQLFFINLAVFGFLKIYIHRHYGHWCTLFFGLLGAGMLHGALTAYAMLFLSSAVLLVSIPKERKIPVFKIGMIGTVLIIGLIFGFSLFGDIAYSLEGGLTDAIGSYQLGLLSEDARTHYKSAVSLTSPIDLILFIPISFFQYLFEPFPWHVSAFNDIVLVLENILRASLLWGVMSTLLKAQIPHKRLFAFLAFAYLGLELIWSIGTINWGTALRHHIPAWGLLILCAYGLKTMNNNLKQ